MLMLKKKRKNRKNMKNALKLKNLKIQKRIAKIHAILLKNNQFNAFLMAKETPSLEIINC